MNLIPFYIAVEALGWCVVAHALVKANAKPMCPAKPIGATRGSRIVTATLVISTLATIYFAAVGSGLTSALAFTGYSLAWLRFETQHDAKKTPGNNRSRRWARRAA